MKQTPQDINKCSPSKLNAIFEPLNQFKNHVFWIRDREMTKQIFTSDAFQSVWGREQSVLIETPMIWFDYLSKDFLPEAMQQLQDRHNKDYCDRKENLAFYQIDHPDNKKRYICCQAIKCISAMKEQFIVGVAVNLPPEQWRTQYELFQFPPHDETLKVVNFFLKLLKEYFGMKEMLPDDQVENSWQSLQETLLRHEKIKLSIREIECLSLYCQGKTAKQSAKEMEISPRTVEDYLANIKLKAKSANKLALISQFSLYFR